MRPLIDRNRCEGKAACVEVCPYDVFDIAVLSTAERRELSLIGRIRALVHGGVQAVLVNPDQCHACGLCVKACPEDALTLVPDP